MIRVFGGRDSRACLKALRWMDRRDITYRYYMLDMACLDPDLLDAWLGAFGWAMLIDKRTAAWRHLPQDIRENPDLATRELLLTRPAMLKVPIIEAGDSWLLGWNAPNKVRLMGQIPHHIPRSGQYGPSGQPPAPLI